MKKLNLIIALAMAAGLIMSSCTKDLGIIVGTGSVTTEILNVDQFSKIIMNGAENVTITYGEELEVKATGHPNIINRIETRVTRNTWTMQLERGTYGNYHLEYEITLPALSMITNNGAAIITIEDFVHQEELFVTINGTGNFKGFNMPVDYCTLDISGLGFCEVNVKSELDVSISGAGKVYYKGNPDVSQHISGLGTIVNVD